MSITIELSWPDRALSPNSRKHWRAKSRYQQDAHKEGYIIMDQWLRAHQAPEGGPKGALPVLMLFCPPDRRGRDLDNLGASMKWALDGIADALDINDRAFRPVTSDWGDVCKPGKVIVKIGS
jgi:crossover junction endodeoxyribonuclease RusA